MQTTVLFAAILFLAAVGYLLGRGRAMTVAGRTRIRLHSPPSYYGYYAAMWCALPAFAIMLVWATAQPHVIDALTVNGMPPEISSISAEKMSLVMNDAKNIEHIGDHCTNIAEDIYYLVHGQPWHKVRLKGEEGIFLPPGFGPKSPGKKESAGQK